MVIHDTARIQCLFCRITCSTLIALIRTDTKILKCLVVLCPRLSESFPLPLYIFDNNSSFWKYQYFCLKRKFFQKTPPVKVESFQWHFWPKPNRKNSVNKKLFYLGFLLNAPVLYLHESFEKDFGDLKEIKILKFVGDSDKFKNN